MGPNIITCTRRLQFCAGHRVLNHESRCASFHGHNYLAYFTAAAPSLDAIGRVIDFGVLKIKIGCWIDQFWNHGFILYDQDADGIAAIESVEPHKLYLMGSNPTAENMADFLLTGVCPTVLQGTGVEVVKVVLWETEDSCAEARRNYNVDCVATPAAGPSATPVSPL